MDIVWTNSKLDRCRGVAISYLEFDFANIAEMFITDSVINEQATQIWIDIALISRHCFSEFVDHQSIQCLIQHLKRKRALFEMMWNTN